MSENQKIKAWVWKKQTKLDAFWGRVGLFCFVSVLLLLFLKQDCAFKHAVITFTVNCCYNYYSTDCCSFNSVTTTGLVFLTNTSGSDGFTPDM